MVKLSRTFAVALLVAATAVSARAQTFYNSEALYGSSAGNIFWGSLGPSFSSVGQPFTINSTISGLSATVSEGGGSFGRRDQGNGWAGSFAPGAQLLWTGNGNGPISLVFSSAISAFGTQVDADNGGAYFVTMTAYGAGNSVLGSFTSSGLQSGSNANTAQFIGVRGSGIERIDLNVSTGNGDFAMNEARLDGVTSTPEPASLVLFGTGLAALGFVRRRVKKA